MRFDMFRLASGKHAAAISVGRRVRRGSAWHGSERGRAAKPSSLWINHRGTHFGADSICESTPSGGGAYDSSRFSSASKVMAVEVSLMSHQISRCGVQCSRLWI